MLPKKVCQRFVIRKVEIFIAERSIYFQALTISAADYLLNARANSVVSYEEYAKNFEVEI